MSKLTIKRTITANYTAADWQLYDYPMRQTFAAELNNAVEVAVNSGKSRREATAEIEETFRPYDHYGARDTEPLGLLESILDKAYGGRQ